MDKLIYNIINDYFKTNNLEYVDLTLKENIDNIKEIIFKSIENIKNIYDEIEIDYTKLPLIVRKIFYIELKKYIEPYLNNVKEQIKKLDSIPLINQREEGWYAFRNELISASSIHNVLNYNGKPNSLLLEKIGVFMPFLTNDAIVHGIIFEIVSQNIYESRNDITIKEYGCIPHKTHSFIGASPDGVVHKLNNFEQEYDVYKLGMYGRLLEIKNPSSRQITNTIKPSYYSQIIAQQEVCQLPICDFLETKFDKYENIDDFFNCKLKSDWFENNISNNNIPLCNLSSNNKEKGVLLKFRKDKSYTSELYPLHNPYVKEEIEKWIDEKVEIFIKNDFEFEQTIYWELTEYSIKTVKFDNMRWDSLYIKSKELWDDILELRKLSDQDIIDKFKNKDLKLIDSNFINPLPQDTKYKLRNVCRKQKKEIKIFKTSEYNF